MIVGICKVKLRASWVQSLKEKRMVVKSIIAKTNHKFNVSISEIESMDIHQTVVIGFSIVTNSQAHADAIMDEIVDFIEAASEAEMLDVDIEIINCKM